MAAPYSETEMNSEASSPEYSMQTRRSPSTPTSSCQTPVAAS